MTPNPAAEFEKELAAAAPAGDTLLTIGVFDGVHLGHQALIEDLKRKARDQGLVSGLITFKIHPRIIIRPSTRLLCLMDLEDRLNKVKALGLDFVIALPFSREAAKVSAREFVQLLRKHLKMRGLVIGPDFALGREREGNAEVLRELGKEYGFTVDVIEPFYGDGEKVSSTLLRQALARGDVRKVSRMMGQPFAVKGVVVHGTEHGRDMGFPTANQQVPPGSALPGNGVYVTVTHLDGVMYHSVTAVGTRPTFGENPRTIETFILDFKGDIYGKTISVDFIDRLRGEVRFGSIEELRSQIARDVQRARDILEERKKFKVKLG